MKWEQRALQMNIFVPPVVILMLIGLKATMRS